MNSNLALTDNIHIDTDTDVDADDYTDDDTNSNQLCLIESFVIQSCFKYRVFSIHAFIYILLLVASIMAQF